MAIEQMTFTVVQGGKGFNASLPSGYQVKGCSPGLQQDAALRERVAAICTHYGQVVYDGKCSAVAAAMDKESAWYRRKQGPPQAFGPQVLDEFPVVWSYAQSSGEWWAATRTCYRGPCPDGKPGNFFSHALVFRPEELRQHGNNPLALCRSGLFMACDPGDSTTLPTLVDLGPASAARLDAELLGRPPWRDRIGAILLALARARSGGRPVVLCVANWREVPPLVEGLLALLPPSARCRTAICTFESDPHWLPSFNGPRRRTGLPPITSLCSAGRTTRHGICTPMTMNRGLPFSISWATASANCPRRGPSPPSRSIACNATIFPESSSIII